jgi:hypothetical protein
VTGRDVVESVALLVSLVPGHSTIGLVRSSAESAKPQCGQRRLPNPERRRFARFRGAKTLGPGRWRKHSRA